jgi:tyrosyl-tRNA synthetase
MTKIITDEQQIEEVLSRGVETVYPDKDSLKKVLMSGKRIKLYCGFDPTGPSLHIGHGNQLRKLAQFQKLGHEVIFLIGDFTAMIGDPTDKSAARKQLTPKEVKINLSGWKKQAAAILDFDGANPVKIMYNSKWLGKLKLGEILDLASNFTVQRMMERDMFEKRAAEGKPIYLHEFMYPLMQGFDSVAMDVDLEIGGNDQTFNMLVGRDLMKVIKNKEKAVLALKLLTDPTGKKMGKTEGNMITLVDSSKDMFGKIMSWSDPMIKLSLEICTEVPLAEIEKMAEAMSKGANPRDYKMRLAYEIVKIYRSEKEAEAARDNFIKVFSEGQKPAEVKSYKVKSHKVIDVLVETGLASSNSEAHRLIEQKGVKSNDVVIEDLNQVLSKGEHLIQKGKRFFVKVIIE